MMKTILGKSTLLALLILSLLTACKETKTETTEETPEQATPAAPPTPVVMVFLVPMDDVSTAAVTQLKDDFYKNFGAKQTESYQVEVLPHLTTPDSCLNEAKTRFRANKMMKTLSSKYSKEAKKKAKEKAKEKQPQAWAYHIVGVTNKDISTSVHGKADYGILGLSFLGQKYGDASVVSTYRLKRSKDLWKLTAHEFCHGFYGCPHCKNDDPHCLMGDAKGGNPHFEIKEVLCSDCAKICVK